jgi:putative membrane protein
MRIVTWTIRIVVFLLLAAFAAKNVEPVSLRFYFDLALTAPLIVILLGFFAAGALFGVLALVGTLLRQRREISALKRQGSAPQTTVLPPPPPF